MTVLIKIKSSWFRRSPKKGEKRIKYKIFALFDLKISKILKFFLKKNRDYLFNIEYNNADSK